MKRLGDILLLFVVSGSVLCMSGCVVFGLWFAPGWANGWPLHQNVVWPTGMACAVFGVMLLLATWLGTIASLPLSDPEWPFGKPSRTYIRASLLVSGAIAIVAFVGFRALAVAIRP
jgi:hypothetical protein